MRKCGILLHPTSLPSKYGIGDLGKSCFEFIDFLESAGMKLWQILPLGHTGFGDSPYQSFSTFACNPLLISPEKLIEKGLITEKDIAEYPLLKEDGVEYDKVVVEKRKLFKKAVLNFDFNNKEYKKWYRENKYWVDDYALFMALKGYFSKKREGDSAKSPEYKAYKENAKKVNKNTLNDCYYGACWNSFPQGLRDRDEKELKKYTKLLKEAVNYYKYIQYEFYTQWMEVKTYANEKGISIIGDIPIFVAADSSDTWANRELFHINEKGFPITVAGVPPDYFSVKGQLWGNPLYNWEKMKEDDYLWWQKRLSSLGKLCDIIRIDHFRAFDTYYSITFGSKDATKGKWKKGPGTDFFEKTAKAVEKNEIIAEDLGDLFESVRVLRDTLGLPGMKILQFAFGSDSGNEYLPFNYGDSNTVVYTGTHDNDTTLGWYQSTDERTRDRFRRILNSSGYDPAGDLIRYAISSPAKYAIIPLQDVLRLPAAARMNTPGVGKGNWQFRFKKEDLTEERAGELKYLCELFNR